MNDQRNVTDEFKGWPHERIVAELDRRGVGLEIAIENLERDFNMGTIVRSANAFGVRHVHIVGRRQWNKRGAMATDKYLHVHYHHGVDAFQNEMTKRKKSVIAVDNVVGALFLDEANMPENAVLVFGAEGSGLSAEMTEAADSIIAIRQIGSTRSLNVGVAAGIAMHSWYEQYHLRK